MTAKPTLPNPYPYFESLPAPRRATKNKLHSLQDIVMITLCGLLSGVEDWVEIKTFAREKQGWLKQFLALPNGMPSHDTLSDVMGRLNPQAFREAFLASMETKHSVKFSGNFGFSGHVDIDGRLDTTGDISTQQSVNDVKSL